MTSQFQGAIEQQVATALRQGRRLTSYSRDGQSLSAEQLPRARTVPACYLLRIGTDRIARREVFPAAEAAAARLVELGTPELIQVALGDRATP